MKQLLSFITCLIVMLGISTNVMAYDFNVDGLYYNITSNSDNTVAVTCYSSSSSSNSNYVSGNLVIPEKITYNGVEYSVTSIGEYAFYGCAGLTSVTVSDSVKSIKKFAFSGCSGLTSVTIPNGVKSIYGGAFIICI